ncbi:MAG: DUF6884 domain-containing protein, partial [Bacillota bacterium]
MSRGQKRIALLSCTKSKTPHPAPARVLYSASPLFRKALAYVEPTADAVYILSARYGLVELDQPLEPYELTLKHLSRRERQEWAERVMRQIADLHGQDLRGFSFAFHTGVEYRAELATLLKRAGATCTCPVEGLPIGERLQFYGNQPIKVIAPAEQPGPLTPPAPAPAPAKGPSSGFGVVWSRILAHAGEVFHQVRGGEFRYRVTGQALRFDRTNMPLPYAHLEEA